MFQQRFSAKKLLPGNALSNHEQTKLPREYEQLNKLPVNLTQSFDLYRNKSTVNFDSILCKIFQHFLSPGFPIQTNHIRDLKVTRKPALHTWQMLILHTKSDLAPGIIKGPTSSRSFILSSALWFYKY